MEKDNTSEDKKEMRIQKYISMTGFASRRKAEELILANRVKVNGNLAKIGQVINACDVVSVDDKTLKIEKKEYYLLNKPLGYVTTTSEQFGRDKVTDLIKTNVKLLPAGRLDMYTTGLLILTNDGEVIQKITHPSKEVEKEYYVTLKGMINKKDIENLEKRVVLDGYMIAKPKVKIINVMKDKNQTKLSIVIHEGRNRQVRRMCEIAKLKVLALHRKRIGKLILPEIKPGKYIKIDKKDLEKLYN